MGIKIYWYTPIPNSPLGIKNAPTHMAINTKALMAQNLKHLKTTFTLLSAYIIMTTLILYNHGLFGLLDTNWQ